MDYFLLPPEVNSGRMYTGPGSGPMLAAAAGWDAVAAVLESTASGYSSEVSGLTGQAWHGPSSMAMTAAAMPYVAWLHATAIQAAQTSAQAYGAAAAYEAAFAMTVPPPVIAANRALLMALIATNFFGQNTPAIAACEAQYMAMWVQDASAMYTYAADCSTLSTLTPFNEPPRTTNEAGQGAQARAVAQTAGNATSAHTQSLVQLTQPAASPRLSSPAASPQLSSPVDPPNPMPQVNPQVNPPLRGLRANGLHGLHGLHGLDGNTGLEGDSTQGLSQTTRGFLQGNQGNPGGPNQTAVSAPGTELDVDELGGPGGFPQGGY
jgi:hypothetical protein